MELWELDQFGNEVRKILEITSSSITFAMFGSYKLKRFFEGREGVASPPPTTTTTYTTTTATTFSLKCEEKTGEVTWTAVRKKWENSRKYPFKTS